MNSFSTLFTLLFVLLVVAFIVNGTKSGGPPPGVASRPPKTTGNKRISLNSTIPTSPNVQRVTPTDDSLPANSCGNPPELSEKNHPFRVAMGRHDFKGQYMTEMCGKCVRIKGPDGEITATVVSMCGADCTSGTIQLNEKGMREINKKKEDWFNVEWKVVPCVNGTNFTNPGNSTITDDIDVDIKRNGTVKTFTPLVILASFEKCPGGKGITPTAEDVEKLLFQTTDPKIPSLISQTRFCSRGKQLISTQSKVVEIYPPCEIMEKIKCRIPGRVEGKIIDELALQKAKEIGADISKFNAFWMISDESFKCPFGGLGNFATVNNQTARMIIMPGVWKSLAMWIHEMGHNLGLAHANAQAGPVFEKGKSTEYADYSTFMSSSGRYPCPSLPHMAMLGWAEPRNVTLSSLNNTWKEFRISSSDQNPDEALEIREAKTVYFISFRSNKDSFYTDQVKKEKSPHPNDDTMRKEYANSVHLHRSTISKGPIKSLLMSLIPEGKSDRSEEAKLSIKFVKMDNTKRAIVQVCASDSSSGCPI